MEKHFYIKYLFLKLFCVYAYRPEVVGMSFGDYFFETWLFTKSEVYRLG